MAIPLSFQKHIPKVTIVRNHPPGPNRAARREADKMQRRITAYSIRSNEEYEYNQAKARKRARIEKRHEENRQRSAARREAKKNTIL